MAITTPSVGVSQTTPVAGPQEASAPNVPVIKLTQSKMPGRPVSDTVGLGIDDKILGGIPEAIRIDGKVYAFQPFKLPFRMGPPRTQTTETQEVPASAIQCGAPYFRAVIPTMSNGVYAAEVRVKGEWKPVQINASSVP